MYQCKKKRENVEGGLGTRDMEVEPGEREREIKQWDGDVTNIKQRT